MKKSSPRNIKIEIEMSPEFALLFGLFVHFTAQGDNSVLEMMTEKSMEEMLKIGQNIIDQVQEKTDFSAMEKDMKDFRNTKEEAEILKDIENFFKFK